MLIAGPSGSGKSTLAGCINGLNPFSNPGECKGTLTVDGVEYVVEAGEGIRYLANKPHIYECHGTQKTKICMVIYYDK